MEESKLIYLVQNELYKDIITLADGDIENVTLNTIEEGILYFLLRYEEITKPQRRLIIQKIWRLFENKNEHLHVISKEKYDQRINHIEDMEL